MHEAIHKNALHGAMVLAAMIAVMVVTHAAIEVDGEDKFTCRIDAGLSVFSEQNATGHWVTKVRLQHPIGVASDAGAGAGSNSPLPVHLQLQRAAQTSSGGARSVALEATLSGIDDSSNRGFAANFDKLSHSPCSLQPPSPAPSNRRPQPSSSAPCPSPCPSQCPSPCPKCPGCPSYPANKRHIPPGYELQHGLGYYRMHLTPVTWFEAKATCEREGAHLAILNSKEEALMVANFHGKYNIPHDHFGILIGIHDLLEEGKYYTVLGQPLSEAGFAEWHPNEPNSYGGDEDCGSVYWTAQLNDVSCNWNATFMCELPLHE